jgi:hypothetical protein
MYIKEYQATKHINEYKTISNNQAYHE